VGSPQLADQLRVFGTTRPTPGLPLITSGQRDPQPIAEAIREALQQLDKQTRDSLGIRGLVRIPTIEYLCIPLPPVGLG